MIKNIYIILVSSLIFSGCSSTSESLKTSLYSTYQKYEDTVNENNVVDLASNYFSTNMLKDVDLVASSPDSFGVLLFKSYIMTKVNHHEKINSEEGCLTINGLDEEKEPVVLSMKYTSGNDSWLIDEVHIIYFDSEADFPKKAKCPSDFPTGFPEESF